MVTPNWPIVGTLSSCQIRSTARPRSRDRASGCHGRQRGSSVPGQHSGGITSTCWRPYLAIVPSASRRWRLPAFCAKGGTTPLTLTLSQREREQGSIPTSNKLYFHLPQARYGYSTLTKDDWRCCSVTFSSVSRGRRCSSVCSCSVYAPL